MYSSNLHNFTCLYGLLVSKEHPQLIVSMNQSISDDLPVYLTRFQWDIAKYPIKQSLRNIADIISKQVGQIDSDLKTKSTSYNSLKGNLQNLEKKQRWVYRITSDLIKN